MGLTIKKYNTFGDAESFCEDHFCGCLYLQFPRRIVREGNTLAIELPKGTTLVISRPTEEGDVQDLLILDGCEHVEVEYGDLGWAFEPKGSALTDEDILAIASNPETMPFHPFTEAMESITGGQARMLALRFARAIEKTVLERQQGKLDH